MRDKLVSIEYEAEQSQAEKREKKRPTLTMTGTPVSTSGDIFWVTYSQIARSSQQRYKRRVVCAGLGL